MGSLAVPATLCLALHLDSEVRPPLKMPKQTHHGDCVFCYEQAEFTIRKRLTIIKHQKQLAVCRTPGSWQVAASPTCHSEVKAV